MITLLQISINFSAFSNSNNSCSRIRKQINGGFTALQPTYFFLLSNRNFYSQRQTISKSKIREPQVLTKSSGSDHMWSSARRKKRSVAVRFNNQSFRFDDGERNSNENDNAKKLANVAFASGFIYLLATDRLGWVWDMIVSIWVFAVLLSIVGVVAFLWWAGKDIVIGSCPNCGNDVQIFKSYLKDELQFCPYCSQPFSVMGNEFISDPVKFSNNSRPIGQTFDRLSKKGKTSSPVVDVEAEIVDAD